LAPENTLVAFEKAVREFQTQMLELDVQLSADGELMVAHDDTLDRCTDARGLLAERTTAELRSVDAGFHFSEDGGVRFPYRGLGIRIPTLREVLRAFPGLRLNIELKTGPAGIEDAFARLLRDERALDNVCVGSEDDALAERVVRVLPECCAFFPRNALAAAVMAIKGGEARVWDERYTVLDMPLYWEGLRLVDAQLLEAVKAADRWVNVWTVDDFAEMKTLISEGVGGVMTDRPDLLRQALNDS